MEKKQSLKLSTFCGPGEDQTVPFGVWFQGFTILAILLAAMVFLRQLFLQQQ
jgi:hypothetical protein